jgi:signal transduction histidine kinase
MSENAVTMAANQVTVVARRVLREPFTARAWRTFLYCFCQPFVDLFGLGVVLLVLAGSTGSAGLLAPVLLAPMLAFARGLGGVHRGVARGLLGWDVPEPMRAPRRPGVLGFFLYHYGDGIGWRAVGYVVAKVLLSVEFIVGVVFRLGLPLMLLGLVASQFQIQSWPLLIFWTLAFLASPRLTELLLVLDQTLMRRLLGPSADSLRIRELEQTRSHAINEAAATLRRIERDLHDGAQARLVALGMQLGRAERQLERGNTESGLELVRETRAEAKAIVQDLRDLVRGIHPPALDSGLEPALSTLAARTPIPTTVRVALETRLSAAAETILYFTATELLTNAAKHSGADAIAVTVISGAQDTDVRLIVTDDGCGGARLDGAGSGLRGLSERLRTMDGQISLVSPVGGPTTVTVQLPVNKA